MTKRVVIHTTTLERGRTEIIAVYGPFEAHTPREAEGLTMDFMMKHQYLKLYQGESFTAMPVTAPEDVKTPGQMNRIRKDQGLKEVAE